MDPESWAVVRWELLGIAGGVFIAMVLAGAETALTSLSAARTRNLIEEGATWLELWLEKRAMVITSILVGKTFGYVTAAALTLDVVNNLLTRSHYQQWGLWVGIGTASFVLLTVAEVIPKAIGKRYYQEVASFSIRYLRGPYYLFYPINSLYSKLTQALLRWLGGAKTTPGPVTFDEIEFMIEERGGDDGEDQQQRLLRSVVEFPDTLGKEIMVPRTEIEAVRRDMHFDEIITTLVRCGHSRLPVYEDSIDEIVGIFYAKDILRYWAEHRDLDQFDPALFLREPYYVPETKPIADLMDEFQRQRMHMAIVVDEFGGTAGIITLEDIIEEIFGDIQDEYDAEPVQLRELGDGRLLADARVPIYEISQYYDIDLPQNKDYESLGGLLLQQAGTVPMPGESFDVNGLHFTVVEADNKRIHAIEITPIEDEEELTAQEAAV